MNDQWYFAYGSNLSIDQKESRTGTIREAKRARLDGYRNAFNKRGTDGSGKANIIQDPSRTVWGVVYWCNSAALDKMDKHEGVSGGHYRREYVRVRHDPGDDLEAVTYIAGESFLDDSLVPTDAYLQTILRGARHHELPEDYICEIEGAAHQDQGNGGEPQRPA